VATWFGVSIDALFDTLANQYRRSILCALNTHMQPMTQSDLLDVLAGLKYGTTADEIAPIDADQLSASLYHLHLPRLQDAGLIEYDRESETVTLTEPADRFSRFLVEFIDIELSRTQETETIESQDK
jgi:DNA-binding transcriptional ArsR family regulator